MGRLAVVHDDYAIVIEVVQCIQDILQGLRVGMQSINKEHINRLYINIHIVCE